jgi:threonine/homoserine/homoserine lactone efflux protein
MGGTLLVGAVRGTVTADLTAAANPSRVGPVAHGALVSLSNPYWMLWWATIGITLAIKGLEFGPVGVLAFFVGHQLADVAWYSVVVFTVAAGRHLLSDHIYRVVMGVLACFLLYLGATFIIGAL